MEFGIRFNAKHAFFKIHMYIGAIKGILYEPFLGIRGIDELSIEKVIKMYISACKVFYTSQIAFLLPTDISADAASTRKYPLVSCHADGYG